MILYEIRNSVTPDIYVGITRGTLKNRWACHKSAAKNYNYRLYYHMKSIGIENFSIHEISRYDNEESLLAAEKEPLNLALS